ncbi:MAG: methyltransferase, partial [Verrucomicrobia bacterium]
MKITGGLAKGIPIKSSTKSTLRPATDYLRQAIFSSLGNLVENASFLDLFAGTGAYGLEAWSRGASGGLFVEKDRLFIPILQSNIE